MKYKNEDLKNLYKKFTKELNLIKNSDLLEKFRVNFLGRHGKIVELMKRLKEMSFEEKRVFGPELNHLKEKISSEFEKKRKNYRKSNKKLSLNILT